MSYGLDAQVPLPTGRRLVISDVHGCSNTLGQLLKQIRLTREDQLFFLGDYINKGPDSIGVLACIKGLIDQGYMVFPLLGNHDFMMFQYLETKDDTLGSKLTTLNGPNFLSNQIQKFEEYKGFLVQLAGFYITGNFLLVHAGFDFNRADPFDDLGSMLNIHDFHYNAKKANQKTIVHGHYPHPLKEIQKAIHSSSNVLPLDNGCVYTNRDGQGNLLCLNLDTFRLWVQPNIESQ